jgi:UDP-2,3-diacylglucosamine pyrophosphatase LpxH
LGSLDEDPYHLENLIGEEMATVFFSDVHCGDSKSRHAQLLEYLSARQKDIDKIVIVGDLLDLWVSSFGEALSVASPLLEYISTNYAGRFHYILGNHDWDLLPLKNIFPFIHKSLRFPVGNKIAVALHGHLLDPDPYTKTKFSHYMAWFINKFDRWAKIDTRKSLVSLSERVKNDPYEKLLIKYEENLVGTFEDKFDYVITGHTHIPCIKQLNNIIYFNIGDSMQHSSVLVVKKDGFYLFDYVKKKTIDAYRIPR